MAYLSKSKKMSPPRAADDFNCGWSVMHMLAELGAESPVAKPCQKALPGRAMTAGNRARPHLAPMEAVRT